MIKSAANKMLLLSEARQALSKSDTLLKTARKETKQQKEIVSTCQTQWETLHTKATESMEVVNIVDQLTHNTEPPSPGRVTQGPVFDLMAAEAEADAAKDEAGQAQSSQAGGVETDAATGETADLDAAEVLGMELMNALDAGEAAEATAALPGESEVLSVAVGQQVSIIAPSGKIRTATVIESTADQLKIHFDGFVDRFDEWLPRNSERIVKATELETACAEPPMKKARLDEELPTMNDETMVSADEPEQATPIKEADRSMDIQTGMCGSAGA